MFRMVPDQPSCRSEDFCRRGRKAAVRVSRSAVVRAMETRNVDREWAYQM